VQGREGTLVAARACRWYLNWFMWCPVTLTISGAYSFQLAYKGAPVTTTATTAFASIDDLVHVNPGPALPDAFVANGLNAEVIAGATHRGVLTAHDALGNQALLTTKVVAYLEQYWDGGVMLLASEPGMNAQNVSVMAVQVQRAHCQVNCAVEGNVTLSLGTDTPGVLYFDLYFEKTGDYIMSVSHKGMTIKSARVHICSKHKRMN
jgi:hypothetical protein